MLLGSSLYPCLIAVNTAGAAHLRDIGAHAPIGTRRQSAQPHSERHAESNWDSEATCSW